jgi:opacity protein-like surface antigen
MHKVLIAFAVAVLAAGSNAAAQQKDVMVPVRQFVDGFNKGDTKTALAACADETSIIDDFPPHEWHGRGACATWANDYDADAKKNGITDGIVTLGQPRHIDIAADRAYVVVPASYKFKKNGKPAEEVGSTLTVALQRGGTGWRITAWSWTKR